MDKFTLFELHVHDGLEFSATNTAPAIGRSADEDEDEAYEELEAVAGEGAASESDDTADESSGRRVGPLALLLGVVALAVVAVAVRKLRGSDADLEIAELDDLTDAYDEEEAEH
ncbi:hypothetical protein [Salinigranum halophilum]|uniref:hypothetical protein n=1 Tax=Salinigranum halophilum TaxID=2565931 RepID=UPI0013762830|nr:hypothetical protein [Salinigranum halophilum]